RDGLELRKSCVREVGLPDGADRAGRGSRRPTSRRTGTERLHGDARPRSGTGTREGTGRHSRRDKRHSSSTDGRTAIGCAAWSLRWMQGQRRQHVSSVAARLGELIVRETTRPYLWASDTRTVSAGSARETRPQATWCGTSSTTPAGIWSLCAG